MNIRICLLFITLAILQSCSDKNNDKAGSGDSLAIKDTSRSSQETGMPEPAYKKYELRSGIIHFTVSGKDPRSSKIVFFDEFGNKEVSFIYSKGILVEKWVNSNDGSFYTLDYNTQTGAKRKASRAGTEERFDVEDMPVEMQKENKVRQEKDTMYAGKPCKVYSMESGGIKARKGGWAHIMLFLSTEVADFKFRTEAVSIQENAAIPDSVYTIPGNFKVKEF
ncbi:MAG: hypothetical protein ACJ75J_18490 [Cytophagaceae bacterium]